MSHHHAARWAPGGPRSREVEAAGRWLKELRAWTHFATLTFADAVPPALARRIVVRWLRGLSEDAQAHLWCAIGEDYAREGRPHVHLLMEAPDASSYWANFARHNWQRVAPQTGHARIVRFDAQAGSTGHYLAVHDAWHVGVICHRPPRCRHRRGLREGGCQVGPHPFV